MTHDQLQRIRASIERWHYDEIAGSSRVIDPLTRDVLAAAARVRAKLAMRRVERRENEPPLSSESPAAHDPTAGLPLLILGPGGDYTREVWPSDLD